MTIRTASTGTPPTIIPAGAGVRESLAPTTRDRDGRPGAISRQDLRRAVLADQREQPLLAVRPVVEAGGLRDRPAITQPPDDASWRAMALPTAPVTPAMIAFIVLAPTLRCLH